MSQYTTHHSDLDAKINDLVHELLPGKNEPIFREIMTTVYKLYEQDTDFKELKLLNNTLKDLRHSFRVFANYAHLPKVTIFGSARTPEDNPNYQLALELGKLMKEKGWMTITGGGPGIMEAGNRGAGLDHGFGLNIHLPFEQHANPYIKEELTINYKHFFTRKLVFVKESNATVLMPGGFGTHDEGFESLTLIQTGKSRPRPIILLDHFGSVYWQKFIQLMHYFAKQKLIDDHDLNLFHVAHDVETAANIITQFYLVYHSIRYVDGLTVIRLKSALSEHRIKALSTEFADILVEGEIAECDPTPKEIANHEYLNLPRLGLRFNRRSYGRLYQLIDRINA